MDKSFPHVLIRRTHSGVSLVSHTESFHSFDDGPLYSAKQPGAYTWEQADIMSTSQKRRIDSGFADLDAEKENDSQIDTMNETKLEHRPSSIHTSASASQSDSASASHKPRSISSRTKRKTITSSSASSRRNSHHRRSQPSSIRSSEVPAPPISLHRAGTLPTSQPVRSKPASRKNSLYAASGGTTSDPYLAHARAKEILQALDPIVRATSNNTIQASPCHLPGDHQNVDATTTSLYTPPTGIISPTSQYTVTSQYSLISPPTHHSMPLDQDSQPEPAPASPPQTIVYWMHPASRLEEYERHDRNRRGVRGFLRKFFVWGGRKTFYEQQENGADDDKGSVRRYRLDLSGKEGEKESTVKEVEKDTQKANRNGGWKRLGCFS